MAQKRKPCSDLSIGVRLGKVMDNKTPWRECTTEDGYICLLHDNGKLYFGIGHDNECPQDVGRQCHKKIANIGKRWKKD